MEALWELRGLLNHIFRRAGRSKYEDKQARLSLKIKQVFDDSSTQKKTC